MVACECAHHTHASISRSPHVEHLRCAIFRPACQPGFRGVPRGIRGEPRGIAWRTDSALLAPGTRLAARARHDVLQAEEVPPPNVSTLATRTRHSTVQAGKTLQLLPDGSTAETESAIA